MDTHSEGEPAEGGATGLSGSFVVWSLHMPLLFQLNIRGSHVKAGLFVGPYLYLPLLKTGNEALIDHFQYAPNQPGGLIGMNFGWKLDPGFLFFDTRFEYDGHWFDTGDEDRPYFRNMIKASIGYEWGLLRKKPKAPKEPRAPRTTRAQRRAAAQEEPEEPEEPTEEVSVP